MINWKNGSWLRNNADAKTSTTTVTIAADWAPVYGLEDLIIQSPAAVYGDLLETIQKSDLSIVNLESPITTSTTQRIKAGPNFKGDPRVIKSLKIAEFDIVTLANNHVLDYELDGLKETLDILTKNDIKFTGAGIDRKQALKPLIVKAGDITIGIVNFCEGEDNTEAVTTGGVFGHDIAKVITTVQKLKSQVDIVLVIAHAGREYIPVPPVYIAKAYRTIIDAGADSVIAHHPHVPQGIELYNDCPIFYSLGNFVFNQPVDVFFRKHGYMVTLNLANKKIAGFDLTPYSVSDQGLKKLDNNQKLWLMEELKIASIPIVAEGAEACR